MTFKHRVSCIEWDPASFLTVEFNFTRRARGKRHAVPIGVICPSQCACPRAILFLVQNPSCSVEFAPTEGFAFGLRDIDNLSIRKAIRSDLAIISGVFT